MKKIYTLKNLITYGATVYFFCFIILTKLINQSFASFCIIYLTIGFSFAALFVCLSLAFNSIILIKNYKLISYNRCVKGLICTTGLKNIMLQIVISAIPLTGVVMYAAKNLVEIASLLSINYDMFGYVTLANNVLIIFSGAILLTYIFAICGINYLNEYYKKIVMHYSDQILMEENFIRERALLQIQPVEIEVIKFSFNEIREVEIEYPINNNYMFIAIKILRALRLKNKKKVEIPPEFAFNN